MKNFKIIAGALFGILFGSLSVAHAIDAEQEINNVVGNLPFVFKPVMHRSMAVVIPVDDQDYAKHFQLTPSVFKGVLERLDHPEHIPEHNNPGLQLNVNADDVDPIVYAASVDVFVKLYKEEEHFDYSPENRDRAFSIFYTSVNELLMFDAFQQLFASNIV